MEFFLVRIFPYLDWIQRFTSHLLRILILIKRCYLLLMMMKMMMNCFCGMVHRGKAFMTYLKPGPISEINTIADIWHAATRVWTWAESEFRLCWMKLCSSDNHYTIAPRQQLFLDFWPWGLLKLYENVLLATIKITKQFQRLVNIF